MKKWKKLLFSFLAVAFAVLIGWNAGAVREVKAESYDGYEYSVGENGEICITKYVGTATEPEIPAEIEGKKVTGIGLSAFSGCSSLTSITIPAGITNIENRTFVGCSTLTKITVDEKNTVYDSREDCNAIIETETNTLVVGCGNTKIPDSVTSIGNSAFSGSGLTSITIPAGVTSIGGGAFGGCSGLTSVTIPDGVTSIGYGVFMDCSGLKSVMIPNNVTIINELAFSGCSGLTSITIPDSVTSIANSAFFGCSGLTEITIPGSVTSIGFGAFSSCSGLTKITVDEENEEYDSREDCNAIIDTERNILVAGCCNTKIPAGVTSIEYSAFSGCNGLTSITIPDSVTSIGSRAFSGCSGLTNITIPAGVTSIEGNVFFGCSGLTSITVDKKNTVYDSREGCNAIIETKTNTLISGCCSTTIPSGVINIGYGALFGCSGLASVTIPDSVTRIEQDAFSGCSGLTSVTIPDSVTRIEQDVFWGCSSLTDIAIPGSVTSIGFGAFYCSGLTSITIPNSVTNIEMWAFAFCDSLTSITIPESVTSIDDGAFEGCPDHLVIWTTRNSCADSYGKENGITVKYIGEPEEPTSTPAVPQPPAQVQSQPQAPDTGVAPAREQKRPSKAGLAIKGGAKAKAGKKKLTLTWKKVADASGYEIQFSRKKNFKGAEKLFIKNTKKSCTIKKLKRGTTYYIRIRAYTEQGGKRVYGKWSKTEKVKCK